MSEQRLGIIMNGVTGRMGTNQHLIRSICAIRNQGGVALKDGSRVMPDPVLVGRNPDKLSALAKANNIERWTTDLDAALADKDNIIYFDAQTTDRRAAAIKKAIKARKHIYCEKPTATSLKEALELYRLAKKARVKQGVVQDKLWLPGLLKLKGLIDAGFFGRILSVRGEFGYWVFDGSDPDQKPQRPSWNYRKEDGGGIIVDMLCHWRYLLDNLFGSVRTVNCLGATHIPKRWDENGKPYKATADDACYATFELDGGTRSVASAGGDSSRQPIIAQINSSWCVRVRRDDLVIFQVDGTEGSAVAGLTRCFTQSRAQTPRPVWNPDQKQTINFFDQWQEVPDAGAYENAFKVQWEMFIRHVCEGAPFRWNLLEGAKGVQLAELGLKSWQTRRWQKVAKLKS
jgi:predicted dehydrogenase